MTASKVNNTDKNIKDYLFRAIKYVVIIPMALLALFPFAWVLVNSFRNNDEIFSSPFGLPHALNFKNFIEAWATANIGTYFLNSMIVSVGAVLVLLVLATMTSFILSRVMPSKVLYLFLTLGLMIPIHAMLIPTFTMFKGINILNTRTSLILVYCASNLSLAIFILVGFMKGLPKEIEESATIDGAGIFRIFFNIILPISKPGIATIATLSFLNAWNDFLYAQVLISDPLKKVLTQGIANLKGQYSTDYGLLCAGLLIAIIPVTVVYILFQEQVVKGMTAGAVKG